MKTFMGKDFLLHTETAQKLFYEYAEKLPIFDFHNHLSPKELYENKNYSSITELWLAADHYKWRAMRAAGIDEQFITGSASELDKFKMWAKTVQRIPGSPLYHWAHLELKRYFGIEEPLCEKNAEAVFNRCNELLAKPDFAPISLLTRTGVVAMCTTDDPFDTLEWHLKIRDAGVPIKVLPSFRPDKVLHIQLGPWADFVGRLGAAEHIQIDSFEQLKAALSSSMRRFVAAGCLTSDHGFERFGYIRNCDDSDAERVFAKAMRKEALSEEEVNFFRSRLLLFLGKLYVANGVQMQIHLGAARNFNTKIYSKLGPDSGIDSVGLPTDPFMLGQFLDDLNLTGELPRTVLYCLNPADNAVLTTLAVSFCSGSPGKVQTGSAWWFLDTLDGIRAQLKESANAGLLTAFVGMLTDSRSVSSFVRHEYFRRILCDVLGEFVENGEFSSDLSILGPMVQDVCYHNAANFFSLN